MTFCLQKTTIKRTIATTLMLMSVLCWVQPASAADAESKAIAMQIAEKQTQGKAVRAQFRKTPKKSGFVVRLIKDGKVIHKFVPMQRIERN